MTGWRLISSIPAMMRCLSSYFEATRIWRNTERASLEKKPSMRLSQEPCVGVKVNSKRCDGCWASQALAHMARLSRPAESSKPVSRGGLPALKLQRIEEFVRANLGDTISLSDLSGVAGLSKRHFLRAFQESTGTSPHRYVLGMRIEQAKRRLSETDESLTSSLRAMARAGVRMSLRPISG